MVTTIERTALTQLVNNEQYARKVLPFLKGDYFADRVERTVYEEIAKFVDKYNKIPTQTALEIEVQSRKDLNGDDFAKVVEVIKNLEPTDVDFDFLVNTTEQFCKDRAVYNAIIEGISIIDGKDKKRTADAIPSILTDALAVGFDNRVGHDTSLIPNLVTTIITRRLTKFLLIWNSSTRLRRVDFHLRH